MCLYKPSSQFLPRIESAKGVMINLTRVRVTITAVNILKVTPINKVQANPCTVLAPKLRPKTNKIIQTTTVAKLESRIEDHARLKPLLIAFSNFSPSRSSSFIRSKTKILASTAMPVESKKPAIAGKVIVTPNA